MNNSIYNSKLGFGAARFDSAENITTGMSEPSLELNEDEILRERQVPSTVTESQLPSRSLNAEASPGSRLPPSRVATHGKRVCLLRQARGCCGPIPSTPDPRGV